MGGPSRPRLEVWAGKDALAARLAGLWRESARHAVRERGTASVALSGGRSPAFFLRAVARERDLPWERTHLFQVDERLVEPESPERNWRLIRENLLELLPQRPAGLHPVPDGRDEPERAARAYAERILALFGKKPGDPPPSLDLVLLGLGADGHTASLFPGSPALAETRRITAAVAGSGGGPARVTMTLPLLNAARSACFLVVGEGKREALARLLSGDRTLPAARVRLAGEAVRVLADAAAAG